MFGFYHSTIGKKIIVALTGIILVGFVMGHLLGNLQVFVDAQQFNDYAAYLKKTKPLLWGTRLVLLISVFFHILCTVQLTRQNRQSRPEKYSEKKNLISSLASRTMIFGGLFLVIYIVYHLLHFTVGSAHPEFSHTDIYRNVVIGFSHIGVSLFYILGMVALGFHLYHGVWSLFQTLGLNHPKYNIWRRVLATTVSLVIAGGYISIPLGVLMGVVR